jgi:hypothetical protein
MEQSADISLEFMEVQLHVNVVLWNGAFRQNSLWQAWSASQSETAQGSQCWDRGMPLIYPVSHRALFICNLLGASKECGCAPSVKRTSPYTVPRRYLTLMMGKFDLLLKFHYEPGSLG